jgi:DNA-binding MarR family transcriptional regulator
MPASVPLPTLLSQALVAHTIEIDNEAEHRLPHRTTRQGEVGTGGGAPWLVSFALWANVLQHLDGDGTTVAELHARARTGLLLLSGLRRWGYVTITAPAGQPLRNPPQDMAVVRPRDAALRAGPIWAELPGIVDERWHERLGAPAVGRLERALCLVFDRLPIEPPAYLPVVHPTQGGKVEAPRRRNDPVDASAPSKAITTLSPLLSGVLQAFTVDAESTARLAMSISANTLRVLDRTGSRVGELPRLTGVSREANAMCIGWLERRGCAIAEPDPTARRGKVIRLTPKGETAQRNADRRLFDVEESWRTRYGTAGVDDLRAALDDVVGDGTFISSPLAPGLVPYPDNWRARVRRPDTLPHHPMVLHRGGYPDGS